jgi:hypothetical protein
MFLTFRNPFNLKTDFKSPYAGMFRMLPIVNFRSSEIYTLFLDE